MPDFVRVKTSEGDFALRRFPPPDAMAKKRVYAPAYGKTARVLVHGTDYYGRTVGEARVGNMDSGEERVKSGFAWAYRRSTDRYVRQEEQARRKRGLRRDAHPTAPWDWRRRTRRPAYR
jgi:endonuclease YncB( thermonuclease family)